MGGCLHHEATTSTVTVVVSRGVVVKGLGLPPLPHDGRRDGSRDAVEALRPMTYESLTDRAAFGRATGARPEGHRGRVAPPLLASLDAFFAAPNAQLARWLDGRLEAAPPRCTWLEE